MSRVLAYLVNAVPYMLCALPVYLPLRIFYRLRTRDRWQTTFWHELGLGLLVLFAVGVASQTVIPKLEFGQGTLGIVNQNLAGRLNLIPGMLFVDLYRECVVNGYFLYFVLNVLGNLGLFLPIGFALPLLWRRMTGGRALLIALGASLCIELGQLFQARGCDIDDLWLNVLGAWMGWGLYRLLAHAAPLRPLREAFWMKPAVH